MTPQEIIAQCDKQMELLGKNAQVGFVMPGRWSKRNTKRLWTGGPVGEIVNDFGNGTVYVLFSAQEVKESVLKELAVIDHD